MCEIDSLLLILDYIKRSQLVLEIAKDDQIKIGTKLKLIVNQPNW
jgi:hypothetical protein